MALLTRQPLDIILNDERLPVVLERGRGDAPVLVLAKGVLVDDPVVVGCAEEGRGDPRLKKEPLLIS